MFLREFIGTHFKKLVSYIIIVIGCFAPICSIADENSKQDDAELIKLRIKELELKKDILELEAKKSAQKSLQTPQHSYSSPENLNQHNFDSSRYIRGPRGGCYTFTKSGNKRYVDRSLCN